MHVIVPVKCFELAKQRLAGPFTPEARQSISRAMAEWTLRELTAMQGVNGVLVVTAERRLHGLVRECGFDLEVEPDDSAGLNAALTHAVARLRARKVSDVCIVHSDIPLFTAGELQKVLEVHRAGRKRQMTMVTDSTGQGTNVRMCRPPDAVPCLYGPRSAYRHEVRARLACVHVARLTSPTLSLDLDYCEDISAILQVPSPPAAQQCGVSAAIAALNGWALNTELSGARNVRI